MRSISRSLVASGTFACCGDGFETGDLAGRDGFFDKHRRNSVARLVSPDDKPDGNQARTRSVHKAVLESVRVRDTAGARSAMNRLLDLAEEDYRRVA
jgi:DNA-binding GntR family transcriptional regulator